MEIGKLQISYNEPGLLIRADYVFNIIKDVRHTENTGTTLLNSTVGDIYCGKTNINNINIAENKLNKELMNFWKLETIGITDNPYEIDDEIAVEKFEKTIHK